MKSGVSEIRTGRISNSRGGDGMLARENSMRNTIPLVYKYKPGRGGVRGNGGVADDGGERGKKGSITGRAPK